MTSSPSRLNSYFYEISYPVLPRLTRWHHRRVNNVINGEATFGLVPHDHWFQPDWIDEKRATAGREKMVADNIIYGGSVSYRNMCRYNSGVRPRVFALVGVDV